MSKTTRYWGIDLGGTKIEGVVLSDLSPDSVLTRIRIDTEADGGYGHVIKRIATLVSRMIEESGAPPELIGVGHPGAIVPSTGLLKHSNAVALNGHPLPRDIADAVGYPVISANDANCFALAEARLGAAKGAKVCFGVILGTGVGGGVVVNGEVLDGRQGIAGEWGHNPLDHLSEKECRCGKKGCVEKVIAGPALEEFYRDLTGASLRLRDIVSRAEKGTDPSASATVSRLNEYFGKAIAVVINILDPDVIVVGGGVSNVPSLYTDGVASAKDQVFNSGVLETKIVPNLLGDSAGVFGAAMLTARQ